MSHVGDVAAGGRWPVGGDGGGPCLGGGSAGSCAEVAGCFPPGGAGRPDMRVLVG